VILNRRGDSLASRRRHTTSDAVEAVAARSAARFDDYNGYVEKGKSTVPVGHLGELLRGWIEEELAPREAVRVSEVSSSALLRDSRVPARRFAAIGVLDARSRRESAPIDSHATAISRASIDRL